MFSSLYLSLHLFPPAWSNSCSQPLQPTRLVNSHHMWCITSPGLLSYVVQRTVKVPSPSLPLPISVHLPLSLSVSPSLCLSPPRSSSLPHSYVSPPYSPPYINYDTGNRRWGFWRWTFAPNFLLDYKRCKTIFHSGHKRRNTAFPLERKRRKNTSPWSTTDVKLLLFPPLTG